MPSAKRPNHSAVSDILLPESHEVVDEVEHAEAGLGGQLVEQAHIVEMKDMGAALIFRLGNCALLETLRHVSWL